MSTSFVGKMSYNDDEPIVAIQDDSEEKPTPFVGGKLMATIINKSEAPLEETKFKVMLELTGEGSFSDRLGVDLVMVLDVSGSMGELSRLENLKFAMQFVINKLSPVDRLSVVTFADDSKRLCPLRQITEKSQAEIINQINALVSGGSTNIAAGLQMGLKVLNDRKLTSGRVVGIMLMSDGEQNVFENDDAAKVPVGIVPVYTFGFGTDADPKVLKAIADNSMGGTFSDVQYQNELSTAFSLCLAGFLSISIQDLALTITEEESRIEKVSAGNYSQLKDCVGSGTTTVLFGNLYNKELRKVIVDLVLPAVHSRRSMDVLQITYTYRSGGGRLFEAPPIFITIARMETSVEPERPEVLIEGGRLQIAHMMKQARIMADNNKFKDAQKMLDQAKNFLENLGFESYVSIQMLKSEVQQISKLMKSRGVYQKQGRSFALSSESSHDRQQFIVNSRHYT